MTVPSRPFRAITLGATCCTLLVACDSPSSSKSAPSTQPSVSAAQPTPQATAPTPQAKPDFVERPSGTSVRAFIQKELERGKTEQRTVLVYVGATWCEPCQRFHAAVQNGELDAELPNVRFLALDHDRDQAELTEAGYSSRLIPLIALPKPDGTASELRIEGSIKGPEAVSANLLPRLLVMLERVRSHCFGPTATCRPL